jgi:hypothetical protein
MRGQCPQPNPYGADVIEFKKITHYHLRMEHSGTGKSIDLDDLEMEYADRLFERIPSSEKHTLLRLGDGSTIGIISYPEFETDDRLSNSCQGYQGE